MKGGKGGQGRKKVPGKVSESAKPGRSAARGASKRDWGAIPTDADEPIPPVSKVRLPSNKPPRP